MALAEILSVIEKLEKYPEDETDEEMERLIKEMRDILEMVRDKKLGEGRRLNSLVSDLVHMADDALHLYKHRDTNNLPRRMETIHSWIGVIKERMLKLETTEFMRSQNDGDDEYVVGLEKDVEMLLRTKIIRGPGYVKISLIKGITGSGKTTLARQLYNHADVVDQFKRRAWVCVTDLTLKEILIKLIQQVAVTIDDGENLHASSLLEESDNRSLLDMLRQHLQGMRYLIVLDDVPKQMHLESVVESLLEEYNRSRLLLTSHSTLDITSLGDDDVHMMEFLDSNKSWQLFLRTINGGNKLTSEQKFPKHLEHKAKQMLKICGGLPLAIKQVARELAEKRQLENEWEELLESVDLDSTLELLESFYQKLDPELESGFMYMAFYKENTTMRKEKLEHIWRAGGVYSSISGLSDESVIEVKGKSTKYQMNAVLHKLSIKKAEEKLGFEILSDNGNNRPPKIDPRHRVIICSREKFNYSTNQDKHLVSLVFHGGGYFDASPSYWKSFEQLNILDFEDFGLNCLPETIGTLMKLEYLGLRNNYIQELPHSLGCLENLEVLDIALNFMVEIPDIIWEMSSLRHIYMSDVICRKPLKMDALQHLKTLTYVSIDNWTYELSGLSMLTFLDKLGIEELDGNSDLSKLFVSLAELKYFYHLILRGYRFSSMPCLDGLGILQSLRTLKLHGRLARLPSAENFPPSISSLTLVNSCLDEDPIPTLEKLTSLNYLKLRNAYTGEQMVISHHGFRMLEVLCIEELWNLRNLQLAEGATRWLMKLEIHHCPYLDTLPEEVGLMGYLKELKMVTTKDIATKIRNSAPVSEISIVSIIS